MRSVLLFGCRGNSGASERTDSTEEPVACHLTPLAASRLDRDTDVFVGLVETLQRYQRGEGGGTRQHRALICFLSFCPCQIMHVFSGRMCCQRGWWEDVSACIMLRPLAPKQSGSRGPSSLNTGTLQSKGLAHSYANTASLN